MDSKESQQNPMAGANLNEKPDSSSSASNNGTAIGTVGNKSTMNNEDNQQVIFKQLHYIFYSNLK